MGNFIKEKLVPHFEEIAQWTRDNAPEIKKVFTETFGEVLDSFKEIWEFLKWSLSPLFEEMFKGDDVENWGKVLEATLGLVKITLEVVTAPLRIFAGILRQIREDIERVKEIFSGNKTIGEIFKDVSKILDQLK